MLCRLWPASAGLAHFGYRRWRVPLARAAFGYLGFGIVAKSVAPLPALWSAHFLRECGPADPGSLPGALA
jgi:hypothetical protein